MQRTQENYDHGNRRKMSLDLDTTSSKLSGGLKKLKAPIRKNFEDDLSNYKLNFYLL